MKWKVEKRKIASLISNDKNPRKLSKEASVQLKRSIEKFGVCEPIVINCDGSIIGGHQRVKTLKAMKESEVDVYVPIEPLSEKECNELNIRLNKNAGEWDLGILCTEWDADSLVEWGFSLSELSLESIDGSDGSGESKPGKKSTMNIAFTEAEHLQDAENKIATIVDSYAGATYKVRIN